MIQDEGRQEAKAAGVFRNQSIVRTTILNAVVWFGLVGVFFVLNFRTHDGVCDATNVILIIA